MRLIEFEVASSNQSSNKVEIVTNLLMILNVVLKRTQEEGTDASISTNSLIDMVKNTGIQFDYSALLNAYETNSAVKNIIKNFSQETVDLIGSSDDALNNAPNGAEASGEAIANIAKRVAKRNIG